MPLVPKEDLAGFQYWLEDTRGIGRRTAAVYASRVRAILSMCDQPINKENLDAFMKSAWAERSRDGYYSGWNRFVEFAASKGLNLATPTLRSEARKERKKYEVPNLVLAQLLEFIATSQIDIKLVPNIQWKHFRKVPQDGMWHLDDPIEQGYFYVAPISIVTSIYEWAAPERPTDNSPLIPSKPGSEEPMPLIALRRLLLRYKNSR